MRRNPGRTDEFQGRFPAVPAIAFEMIIAINRLFPEQLFQDFMPVFEDLPYPAMNEQLTCNPAEEGFANFVIQQIGDQNSFGHFPEMMFVVPQAVGPCSLFINEKGAFFDVSDLGAPTYGDIQKGPDPVSYNHSFIHYGRNF